MWTCAGSKLAPFPDQIFMHGSGSMGEGTKLGSGGLHHVAQKHKYDNMTYESIQYIGMQGS